LLFSSFWEVEHGAHESTVPAFEDEMSGSCYCRPRHAWGLFVSFNAKVLPTNRRRDAWQTERGSGLIECSLTVPLILALVYGLVQVGALLWQNQRVALVVQEASRVEFERCFRSAINRTPEQLVECLDDTMKPNSAAFTTGVLPVTGDSYRGVVPGGSVELRAQSIRTVAIVCLDWSATDSAGAACSADSEDCVRSCGFESAFDPARLEVRDSSVNASSIPNETKEEIWDRFGSQIERRGFLLLSEVASGVPGQSFGPLESGDIFLAGAL
jgi:hypothetical protein